jgi:POT family proton-dependent oligopeptide transporter
MFKLQKSSMALSVFFSTEMWERYGFYVAQSLLALFLSVHLQLSDGYTYTLVGSFTALTYISPIIGGWIADNCLGQKHSVLFGAVLLFFSYIVLASAHNLAHLLFALAMIAVGTGLLKPNISALLGKQYAKGDPKRNSGFTIFYLGITLGIVLGTTLPSKLQAMYGWSACFFSASIGLVLAFLVFFFGVRLLKIQDYATPKHNPLVNWSRAVGLILIAYIIFYLVLRNPSVANIFFIVVAAGAIGVVLKIAFNEQGDQRRKTLSLLVLFVISVFFWSFYFQMFTDLTLFITRAVQPTVLGLNFPAPYYVSVQSFGMLVIGVFLARLWSKMRTKNIAHTISIQFTIAVGCILIAYGIILWVTSGDSHSLRLISAWPIMGAYLMISLAELMLSPIGLSSVTLLSSEHVVSTLMGVFFVSLGLGGFISGQLAKIAAIHDNHLSLTATKSHYFHSFSTLTMILAGAFVVTCFLSYLVKCLSRGITWEGTVVKK